MSMNSGPCRGNFQQFKHRGSRMSSNHNEPRVRSVTDLPSVSSPKRPEPFLSIPAQVLVEDNCRVHCGMVRKENRFNKWQDRYLVLHKGCLYYYKDSTDKVSQGQFSLSGYRLSTAPEKTKYEWTFKLIHIQPEKRKYYFSAHSQKELTEWFDKISEDMLEYCESVRQTRPHGYTPENIQGIYPSNGSYSNSGSGEDDKEEYDYPIVNPPSIDEIREQWKKKDSPIASHFLVTANSKDDTTYCPPPAEFPQKLNTSINSSSLHTVASGTAFTSTTIIQQTKHKNVTITGAGKASVDVSELLKQDNTIQDSVTLSSMTPIVPPRPTPRKTSSQNRISVNPTSEAFTDDRPEVPPRPTSHPKPLPRPPKADTSQMLPVAWPTEPCEEDCEDYLKIIPDDEPVFAPTTKSTVERMRPDGRSFKERPSETAQCIPEDVLPDSAKRNDLNKTEAIPLLLGREGVYMIHSSRGGDIKEALSVYTGQKVKHFLIFRNTEGYALDPHGPRFKTKRNMLVYYHEHPLPNQEKAKLVHPYT